MSKGHSTAPKPFVFVLIPFHHKFKDIYKFGIKGAAEDVGAYAERVDEQIFNEGILDRIFNQINKADVIVADMTGRNANVFYEVGYAHALGKIVLLLTQKSSDIPFDLKHRQHIVYGGEIENLRSQLGQKLVWPIGESQKQGKQSTSERFIVSIIGLEISEMPSSSATVTIDGIVASKDFSFPVCIRNESLETSPSITHIYLFGSSESHIVPCRYTTMHLNTSGGSAVIWSTSISSHSYSVTEPLEPINIVGTGSEDKLNQQFRLNATLPAMPPGAVEEMKIPLMFKDDSITESKSTFRLRIHSSANYHDYDFELHIKKEPPKEENANG